MSKKRKFPHSDSIPEKDLKKRCRLPPIETLESTNNSDQIVKAAETLVQLQRECQLLLQQ
jgi:hypothetical protein